MKIILLLSILMLSGCASLTASALAMPDRPASDPCARMACKGSAQWYQIQDHRELVRIRNGVTRVNR